MLKHRRAAISALLTLTILSQTGCYDWEMVKPPELPKLNGGFSEPVARTGDATLIAVRVVDVERPDGTLTSIRGTFDLKVVTKNGQTLTFQNPVVTEREGDDLVVRSANRAPTRIPLNTMERAEVSQYAYGKTAAVAGIGALAGFAAVLLITYAATSKQ